MMRFDRSYLVKLVDTYSIGLLTYLGVSIISAISEWVTFIVFLHSFTPLWAAVTGFFVATAINFLLSHYLAFRSARPFMEEAFLIFSMSGVAFAGNMLAFFLLLNLTGINIVLAKVLGTCCGFVFNYFVRQFFIFSRIPRVGPISAILKKESRAANGDKKAITDPNS